MTEARSRADTQVGGHEPEIRADMMVCMQGEVWVLGPLFRKWLGGHPLIT